jgi:hypothetical protein
MLMGEERMGAEDIATVIMDMLLIGVNTVIESVLLDRNKLAC